VFVDASSLGAALWQANRQGLDPGGECDGIELHPDDARAIPRKFIGRLLGEDEAADLERIVLAGIRKKPPAPSVRRPQANDRVPRPEDGRQRGEGAGTHGKPPRPADNA
jgi:hypothetical protein